MVNFVQAPGPEGSAFANTVSSVADQASFISPVAFSATPTEVISWSWPFLLLAYIAAMLIVYQARDKL